MDGLCLPAETTPTNFTGVPVSIDVVDSNGNSRNIGTATTDANGLYHFYGHQTFQATYTVIRNFPGTNGYWPSNAETTLTVASAHPTVAPTSTPPATAV